MQENQGFLRGKRREMIRYDDSDLFVSREILDEVLKPFICKGFRDVKAKFYVTSKNR